MLPHFTGPILKNPVYKSLFEFKFYSDHLTKSESKILENNGYKIKGNIISFNISDDFEIAQLLLKIKSFDLTVSSITRNGTIQAIYVLSGCNFKNIINSLLDFDLESDSIQKIEVEFTHTTHELFTNSKDYERFIKLNKILNK